MLAGIRCRVAASQRMRPRGPGPGRSAQPDRSARWDGLADQLVVQELLAFLPADGDDLVPLAEDRLRPERRGNTVADHREQRAAFGDVEVLGRLADRRRAGLEVGLDELELALAEGGEVEQLVDRNVLLDRAEDHSGRADQLVHPEVLEQLLVLRVVDPGDGPRDVEMMLCHLADDEVVLVVARHGGDDVSAVAAGLPEVLALAAIVGNDDGTDLVGDLTRPLKLLLHEHDLMAGLDELLGQVIADLAAADDQYEHDQTSLAGTACEPLGAVPDAPGATLDPALTVFVGLATISWCSPPGWLPVGSRMPLRPDTGMPRYAWTASAIRFVRQSAAIPRSA